MKKQGFKVNLEIATNHVLSRKKQSVVAALGVTFGISMYIFMNGLIEGINGLQESITLSTTPHVRIFVSEEANDWTIAEKYFGDNFSVRVSHQSAANKEKSIHNPNKIITLMKGDAAVTGVTPQVSVNVFYKVGASEYSGFVNGVDILEEDQMFDLQSNMVDGNLQDLNTNPNGIIIGAQLASNLNLEMNDNVSVTTANGVVKVLKVIGVFETTIASVDKAKGYVSLKTAQQLEGKDPSYVTEIKVNINNLDNAGDFARKYAGIIDYKIEDWVTSNQQLEASAKLRTIILLSVVWTILIVAGFGIYNILNMTIYEKMKDIAILKALGFSGKDVTQIFLFQAIFIGLCGGVVGLLVGGVISFLVGQIPVDLAVRQNLPISYEATYYIFGFLFGVVTSGVAGYIPARKAAHIDPVEILRG